MFFKNLNRRVKSKLSVCRMEAETSEHIHLAIKAFKWVILPASIFQIFVDLCIFGANPLNFVFWGLMIFFYSNFLPDLPSIFRTKRNSNRHEDLPWYKKYALLLFAPLLIWALLSGIKLNWRTAEDFHNFKSLAIYGAFLFICGFLAVGNFPKIESLAGILSFTIYGIVGYLTHLKVDKIW